MRLIAGLLALASNAVGVSPGLCSIDPCDTGIKYGFTSRHDCTAGAANSMGGGDACNLCLAVTDWENRLNGESLKDEKDVVNAGTYYHYRRGDDCHLGCEGTRCGAGCYGDSCAADCVGAYCAAGCIGRKCGKDCVGYVKCSISPVSFVGRFGFAHSTSSSC
jgi:hypothetical protein